MDTIMHKALADAAYTAWYRNAVSGKLNGANIIYPGNSTGVWAGHLLVDILQVFEPAAFVLNNVIYVMRDYRELPACVVMHEVGHVIEATARRPVDYVGNPHSGKGARFEKRADLYALRWAVTQDDPGRLYGIDQDLRSRPDQRQYFKAGHHQRSALAQYQMGIFYRCVGARTYSGAQNRNG